MSALRVHGNRILRGTLCRQSCSTFSEGKGAISSGICFLPPSCACRTRTALALIGAGAKSVPPPLFTTRPTSFSLEHRQNLVGEHRLVKDLSHPAHASRAGHSAPFLSVQGVEGAPLGSAIACRTTSSVRALSLFKQQSRTAERRVRVVHRFLTTTGSGGRVDSSFSSAAENRAVVVVAMTDDPLTRGHDDVADRIDGCAGPSSVIDSDVKFQATAGQGGTAATEQSVLGTTGNAVGERVQEGVDPPSESAPSLLLVQYMVLRKDLIESMGWSLGSVVAQACHASVAAMWLYRDDPLTQLYCSASNIDHMRKVVLEVKGEKQLVDLAEKLTAAGVGHKLWVEQPENFPTCLATKPCVKDDVAVHFKKCKLCK